MNLQYLLSQGRQAEAVATVHGLAYKNKRKTWLTEEILDLVGGKAETASEAKVSTADVIKQSMGKFSTQRLGPLFANRRIAISSTWRPIDLDVLIVLRLVLAILIWFCWFTLGMGYPLFNAFLPQYLLAPIHGKSGGSQTTSENVVYRNFAITSIVGIPGSVLAWVGASPSDRTMPPSSY